MTPHDYGKNVNHSTQLVTSHSTQLVTSRQPWQECVSGRFQNKLNTEALGGAQRVGLNGVSGQVVDASLKVRTKLGPGLLESGC